MYGSAFHSKPEGLSLYSTSTKKMMLMTKESLSKGKQALAMGDFDQALAHFQFVSEHAATLPEKLTALIQQAHVHDEVGNFEAALKSLASALELDRNSAAVWNNIGVVCQKLQRLEEAKQAFENAYRLDPENPLILISLGSIALKQSDPGYAKQMLDLALEFDPTHPLAHANMALTLAVFGRLEEAEEELRLAVLHGFEGAAPIQERIEKLKHIRDEMHNETHDFVGPTDEDESEQNGNHRSDATELLSVLERQLHAGMEALFHRTGSIKITDTEDDVGKNLLSLKLHVATLRRSLGIPVVTDSDVVMGQNYMEDFASGQTP